MHKFLIITQINVIHCKQEKRHSRKECGSVRTYFQFLSRVHLKSTFSQSFQLMILNAFKQLE